MPPQEPFALRRYLRRTLQNNFPIEFSALEQNASETRYREHLLLDVWSGKLLQTPRDVVRVCEAVKFSWKYVPAGADLLDFVWLQLIKLKKPSLYEWTLEYLASIGAYRDGGRAGDHEPREQAEKLFQLLKELNWHERSYHSGIDQFLPGVDSFVLDGDQRKVFQFNGDELAGFERDRRLGSPSHWRQYFSFDAPSYAIRDSELEQFRLMLQNNVEQAGTALHELANRPHGRKGHFLDVFLDRLLDIELSDPEAIGLLNALANTMDSIESEIGEVSLKGTSEIWRKAMVLAARSPAANLTAAIRTGNSVNWLARVVRDQGLRWDNQPNKAADGIMRGLLRNSSERQLSQLSLAFGNWVHLFLKSRRRWTSFSAGYNSEGRMKHEHFSMVRFDRTTISLKQ